MTPTIEWAVDSPTIPIPRKSIPGVGGPGDPLPAPAADSTAGRLHSWDISTGTDGPGTRFVAFLAGCPLRCRYCHNPDTWRRRNGRVITVDELAGEFARYRRFVSVAGGGVTVSGGEPLAQPEFTTALLAAAKNLGLHTALDTSGFPGLPGGGLAEPLLANTDLVLLDLKAWHPVNYRRLTGVSVRPTLRFARELADRGIPVWVRFVLVPGVTDDPGEVAGVASVAASLGNVTRVDVLPFHRLGATKYADLGLSYPLAGVMPPSSEQLDRVRAQFQARGLAVT